MIEVKGLVKAFEGVHALDGFDMHVPAGSVYGLVGPNGAGKSTLIRHLSGAYRPDAGTILIGGEPVYENAKVKERIACIPDDLYFFVQASIKDMMRFYRHVYPRFDMERYARLREIFGLDENKNIRKFSKGMQKQAAFWLALCMRPDVMLLDEPVDGLDPVMRRQIWSLLMNDVAENGTTVLLSSHNLRELEDVCDHVGIMNRGKLLLERALSDMQGSVCKLQVVLNDGEKLPELDVLHESATGRIHTLIVRGEHDVIADRVAAAAPTFFELIPLTLEEIFIYELGGENYAISEIVL